MSTSTLTPPVPCPCATENTDRATTRTLAQPFREFAAPTDDRSDDPDRATRRTLAQRFGEFSDDPAACNGTADASERIHNSVHQDGQEQKEPTHRPPWEECDDLEELADLEELDETLFPSYTSPRPDDDAVDFSTPWDEGIERWQPPAELSEQQKTAIDMIISGKKLNQIAQQLGIHRGTLWRWRRHDLDFRRTLDMARARAFQHAIDQLRELVPKAVDIVHSQLENADHRAAFQLLRLVVNVHRDAIDPA